MLSTNIFSHIERNESHSFKQNRIAIKNNEIFYGINSSIRYSKTNEDYKLLDSNINFEIENIKLNSSGTLLAVYNSKRLSVLSLDENTNAVKQYNIAVKLLEKVRIKKILWNETAKADSNLIVLSDDNVVRSFDLNFSFQEPLKSFNLENQASNKKGLILNSICNPVSIALGSNKSNLSSLLTLYVVNDDGDIFSVYPFLPVNEISATKTQVEGLFNESVLLLNSALDGDTKISKDLAINQLRFVNSLWKQLPLTSIEIRDSNVKYFISDITSLSFKDNFAIQGPFSIQPFPDCLYEDEATDIVSIEADDNTELLAVTFKQFGFVILFPDYRLTMKWYDFITDASTEDSVYCLTLLQHEKPRSQQPTILIPVDTNTLLMENNNNLFQVKLSLEGETTKIKKISTNAVNYEGAGIIYDPINNTKTQIVLADSILKIFQDFIDESKPIQVNVEKDAEVNFKSHLNTSASLEIAKLLRSTQNMKLYMPPNLSVLGANDENSLSELSSITSSILNNLKHFHKFGILINYKLNNINTELQNQITTTKLIFEKYSELRKTNDQIAKLVERQKSLNKRFDALKETVSKSSSKSNLSLSSKEKQWFKEISLSVTNFNKSLQTNELLKEQLKFIRNELKNLDVNNNISNDEEFDWNYLNLVLKQGEKLLQATANNLNSNLKDLDSKLEGLSIQQRR